MSKIYRILLFVIAMYMYYLFIIDAQDPVSAVGQIVLVACLIIAMEVVRRGSNKVFQTKSKLEEIDEMDEEKFIGYIAELYKRQCYQVYTVEADKNKGFELKAFQGKDSLWIKCMHVTEEIEKETISEVYDNIKAYKTKKCVVVTNNVYTQEAIEFAKAKEIELIDRFALYNLICKVINRKEMNEDVPNAQEA